MCQSDEDVVEDDDFESFDVDEALESPDEESDDDDEDSPLEVDDDDELDDDPERLSVL